MAVLLSSGFEILPFSDVAFVEITAESVCFWENHEIVFDDIPGPNHLSLEEAQKNFAEFGVMATKFLEHVLPDGPSRFHRADESLDKQT
ncbi:hypothetical protein FRD01_16710 [Microvenator marinus]|uniref:Cysteine-rich CPCC domain-containing protein n=1 Tax=Microvenator marinus TaxID=2600177 RepID=A0A5B8XU76_9DELT|nr:CPCC family cysteine-rich protein [Microvenator marinus]QED28851.1 hypothetical protein FRD01_16710 [Microvenator marinus]